MAFDTSFNITFDQEDLIFKKENTERFRAVENSGLQIGGHRIYFNNSNTYLNTNNGNDGYEFVNNNNTVLSGSLYGDVSIGTNTRNGLLHIYDPVSPSIGFSSEGVDTKGFSMSLQGNEMIFQNNDLTNFSFQTINEYNVYSIDTNSDNNINITKFGLFFTPRYYDDDYSALLVGIRGQNGSTAAGGSTGLLRVAGPEFTSFRIDNADPSIFYNETPNTAMPFSFGNQNIGGPSNHPTTRYYDHQFFSEGIVAGNPVIAFSDKRIKKNIRSLDKASSLEKMRQIKPCYYQYINFIEKGIDKNIGYIAQEVEKIFPETSTFRHEYIPNIYRPGTCIQESATNYTLTIENYHTKDLLKDNSNNFLPLFIMHKNFEKVKKIQILNVISDNEILIQSNDENISQDVLVYGQQIDDFHVLKYDHIFTHATAALQELDSVLQKQIERNNKIENQIKLLHSRAKRILT